MGLLDFKKKKVSSYAMFRLIHETGKTYSKSILEVFDKVGIVYNDIETEVIIASINYELCRYALYKRNNKQVVNDVINKVYQKFIYDIDPNKNNEAYYQNIISQVTNEFNRIFSHKLIFNPKADEIYHLLFKEMDVNEQIIEKMYILEILSYVKLWINNALGINKTYAIYDSDEEKKKNEYIDFRF